MVDLMARSVRRFCERHNSDLVVPRLSGPLRRLGRDPRPGPSRPLPL